MRRRIVLVVCVAAAVAFALAGSAASLANQQGLFGGRRQTERNRRAAFADAGRRLTRLRLPADAQFGHVVARSQLHELEAANNHADVGETWTVPGTIGSIISYLRRNSPRGASAVSSGYAGRRGSITSRSLTFAWRPVNDVLSDRLLYVSASSIAGDRVELFAQAESIWFSARPGSERFPASAAQIELRVS